MSYWLQQWQSRGTYVVQSLSVWLLILAQGRETEPQTRLWTGAWSLLKIFSLSLCLSPFKESACVCACVHRWVFSVWVLLQWSLATTWQILALGEIMMISKYFSHAKQLTMSLLSAIKHQAQVHGLHYSLSVARTMALSGRRLGVWNSESKRQCLIMHLHHTVMKSHVGVTRGMFAPLLFSLPISGTWEELSRIHEAQKVHPSKEAKPLIAADPLYNWRFQVIYL